MSKDTEGTGCGIKPFMTDKNDPFYDACSWHDQTYTQNSWQQLNFRRKIIDQIFYKQMLEIAGSNPLLKAKAWLYYKLARIFGARFWEGIN